MGLTADLVEGPAGAVALQVQQYGLHHPREMVVCKASTAGLRQVLLPQGSGNWDEDERKVSAIRWVYVPPLVCTGTNQVLTSIANARRIKEADDAAARPPWEERPSQEWRGPQRGGHSVDYWVNPTLSGRGYRQDLQYAPYDRRALHSYATPGYEERASH